jgi:hypothetical protein
MGRLGAKLWLHKRYPKLPNSSIVNNFEQNSRNSTVHIPHEALAHFVKLHPRLDHRVAAGKEYTKATFANL